MNNEDIVKRLSAIEEVLGNISQMLNGNFARDRVGGMELAIEVTGYKPNTIYAKVQSKEIPHTKKGGKLFFSETALRKWLINAEEVFEVKSNKKKRTRPSLIDSMS